MNIPSNYINRITPARISVLKPGEIFVFGSNKQGMHGGGAARTAVDLDNVWLPERFWDELRQID